MLNSFTWGNFFGFLSILLAIYYVGVGILYFRKDLLGLATAFFKPKQSKSQDEAAVFHGPSNGLGSEQDAERSLAAQLSTLIQEAATGGMSRPELLQSISNYMRSAGAGSMANTPAQQVISGIIKHEASAQCNMVLDDGDMTEIWEKV